MTVEKTIRAQARVQLKKRGFAKPVFGIAIILTFFMLVEYVSYLFPTIIQIIFEQVNNDSSLVYLEIYSYAINLLLLLFISPVVLGFIKMMYTDCEHFNLSDVFFYFSNIKCYFKSIGFTLSFLLRTIIPFALFFSPVVTLIVINGVFEYALNIYIFKIAFVLLFLLSAIIYIIYCTKYFLAFKLFSNDCTMKVSRYFYFSKKIMQGNCSKVIRLFFSFSWWLMLCITVLPILYVLPYFMQAMSLSAKWILELSRNEQ